MGILDATVQVMTEVNTQMEAENARRQVELDNAVAANAARVAAERRQQQEEQRRAQRQAETGRSGGEPSSPAINTQEQARQAQEEARRADEQRQIQEAETRRRAEEQRQMEQQRQAAEQRRQQENQERARLQQERNSRLADNASGGYSTTGLTAPQSGARASLGSGDLSMNVSHVGQCAATRVNVHYALDIYFGEPLVNGTWSFEGEDGCTPPASTKIWLEVRAGSAFGYVELNPSVPSANRGSGFNVAGSPNWSRTVCGFSGARPSGCMDAQAAKAMFTQGDVVGFYVGW